MKKKIYLAGAIGCYKDKPLKAIEWRNRVSEELSWNNNGLWEVFVPTNYYNYWSNCHKSEKEIMRFFFNKLKTQDVVLANLKDINMSCGTTDEILFSYLHGIPVIGFYEDSDDISFVHPWKIEQIDRIETGRDALKNAVEYIVDYYS